MPADQNTDRPAFSELLSELSDSDLVIEIASNESARQTLESGPVKRLREAVDASYKALAGELPWARSVAIFRK